MRAVRVAFAAVLVAAVACTPPEPEPTGNIRIARTPPPAVAPLRLTLAQGAYWVFAWDRTTTSTGTRPSRSSGRFVVKLGAPTTIAGKTLFAMDVTRESGDDPAFTPTELRYVGVDGERLLGSVDGQRARTVFDGDRGLQAGGGFFEQLFPEDHLVQATQSTIENDYLRGAAYALAESAERGKCETFGELGTICSSTRETAIRVHYFRQGVGPVGYRFFGSYVSSGGGASVTTNIGLVDHDLSGAGTYRPGPAPGLARVKDDTGAVSIDVPSEWTGRVTTLSGQSARVTASSDLSAYASGAAPGLMVLLLTGRPASVTLVQVLEAAIGSPRSGCELSRAAHLLSDGTATASVRCFSPNRLHYYQAWVPTERGDAVIVLVLQVTEDSVARYTEYFETAAETVIVYR